MSHLLALGCSHTAGIGVKSSEIYVTLVAQHLNLQLINLAVPTGNHFEAQRNLIQHLYYSTPKLIIAQWPTPYRITSWKNNKKTLETATNPSNIFSAMLQSGQQNFLEPWLQTIITCNMLAKFRGIDVVNILLETADQYIHQRLEQFDIVLHQDDKLPGRTWFFDSAGSDGMHHSAHCHQSWAQRTLEILNENTTQ